jgi:hypothetical protein
MGCAVAREPAMRRSGHRLASTVLGEDGRDLKSWRDTVGDATGVSSGLWLSYVFVLMYLVIAVGGVTHRSLFLEDSIKLPFLNVDLPLVGFFVLTPALFLVVHSYVLLHLVILSDKVRSLNDEVQSQLKTDAVRARIRRQLPSNVFVQIVAGPEEIQSGRVGFMLKLIAYISMVVGPWRYLCSSKFNFFHTIPIGKSSCGSGLRSLSTFLCCGCCGHD